MRFHCFESWSWQARYAPTSLNNLKAKVDDLDVVKLKTISVDFTGISDTVSKEVARNTKINKLNS